MSINPAIEREIFLDAIDINDPDERRAHVVSACGDDAELRRSVDALLDGHERPSALLDHVIRPSIFDPVLASTSDSVPPMTAQQHVGKQIGNYRLMEQIGEGGFGLVFVAQQDKPVQRKVALKIVKPGTDSKEVIARFEAERQAVALMDHTNIAQVFDAGVTDDGRPYFVMELVRGVPITEFCDNQQLRIDERLRLFCDVCQAVHHAHQKGVIHRDIKPSNVMVTLLDGKPIAKVIDFGVAKAIGTNLTDKTIYTRFFSIIGTPLYMSPEQAEMTGADVDTRSDIFSLGVLLYELLAGTTPFDRERLDSAGFDELRRIIREEEPPRPSKRFTTLAESSLTVADRRRTSPVRLSSSIRGDLDWIVMKALDKDRKRRYESAAAMAEDVRRHLNEQPIEARPPSRAYLLSKFARRNRVAIVTMSLIAASLLVGTGSSWWQMRVAMKERDEKEVALLEIEQFAEKITAANSLIASARMHVDSGRMDAAIADLNVAVNQQPSYFLPWVARGQHFVQLAMWPDAADDYAEALALGSPIDTPSWWGTAALFQSEGRDEAHAKLMKQLEQHINDEQPIRDWEWIRNGVSTPGLSPDALRKLQSVAEAWLARPDRPERRGPPGLDNRPERGPKRGPKRVPDGRPERGPAGRLERPPMDQQGRPGDIDHLPRPVREYIMGLVYLRTGQNDLAIETLERSSRARDWPVVGIVHAPLAIAHRRNGDVEIANEHWKRFRDVMEELSQSQDIEYFDRQRTPWFDLVEMRAIFQEADRLFRDSNHSQ